MLARSPGYAGSMLDLRGLQYFRTRAAAALSGHFASEFWNTVVLQAADTEPPVRHALFALSALQESLEDPGTLNGGQQFQHNYRVAIAEYDTALVLTAQSLETTVTPEAVLISNVLFMCIELMQHNYNAGAGHLKHGLRILAELESGLASPRLTDTGHILSQVFRGILAQAIYLEKPYSKRLLISTGIGIVPEFSNLTQARELLENISTLVHCDLQANSSALPNVDLSILLQQWQASFCTFLEWQQPSFTADDSACSAMLKIHALALGIMCDTTCDGAFPATYEAATPAFTHIIDLAEQQCVGGEIRLAVGFTFYGGLIGPLFYTALRCRVMSLRLRAVTLLRQLRPRIEGIWNSSMAASMAQRFIDVELEHGATERTASRTVAGAVGDGAGEGVLTIALSMPNAHERAIRIHIGKDGRKDGAREEVVTW